MVSISELPVVIYGKARTPSRVPQDYRVLAAHPRVARELVREVETIPAGFGWAPTPQSNHAPCFAYLQIAGRHVILRFLDIGNDDQGRPHCLRLEVAQLDDDSIAADDRRLASLLLSAAWPDGPLEMTEPSVGLKEHTLGDSGEGLADAIASHRKDGVAPAILVGDPRTIINARFPLLYDPGRKQLSAPDIPPPIPATDAPQPRDRRQAQPVGTGVGGGRADAPARPVRPVMVLLATLAGMVLAGAPLAWFAHQQLTEVSKANQHLAETRLELTNQQAENAQMRQKVVDREKELINAHVRGDDLAKTDEEWKKAAKTLGAKSPDQLQTAIVRMKSNASTWLKDENNELLRKVDELESERKQLKATLKQVEDVIQPKKTTPDRLPVTSPGPPATPTSADRQ